MIGSAPIRQTHRASHRQVAGACVLASIAFIYFAIVVAAVALRSDPGPVDVADVSLLAAIAPYAIALAVAHGLLAHFAMSPDELARRAAFVFAAAGALVSVLAAVGVILGVDSFLGGGRSHGIAWDGVGILGVIAAVYVVAAVLLRRDDRDDRDSREDRGHRDDRDPAGSRS
jgi:hypothetical protein